MFAEDLSPFFDVGGFASTATLDGATVQAIVDTQADLVLGDVVTQGPAALLTSAQAASAAPGQAFVAGGINYSVRQVLPEPPDGALVRLVLTRA